MITETDKQPKAKLTTGSVSRGLLGLTLPMILGISASIIANIIETWFLGQVGTTELAAYSFTFPVTGALTSLSLGVSIGLSSVLARTVGQGDQNRIQRLTTDGVALATLIMLLMGVIGYFTIDALFTAMGATGTTLDLIRGYMQIWYLGLIFIAVPFVGSNALRATGDARISGTIMVGGSILNVLLDPILIFGWGSIPALGLNGAALALVLGRGVLFLVTFYVLYARENLLDLSIPQLYRVLDSWKQIMTISIPATATQLIGPVSTAIIVSLLAGYGEETVAGFGIASRIEGLSVIPLFALSASIGPYVGQNWGAKLYQRANRAMNLSFMFSVLWGLLVALLLALVAQPLIGLFDDNQQVRGIAVTYLYLVPLSYGGWGVLMMASAIFNSLGRPLRSTLMSVTRMFVLYVPMAVLAEQYFGYIGIFASACATNLIMGLTGFVWNRKTWGPAIHPELA
jgi:putative MATE family efflux protein